MRLFFFLSLVSSVFFSPSSWRFFHSVVGVIRSLTFSRPSHIYSCASLPFLRPSPVYYRRICHFLPFLSFWFHSFERRRRWESRPDIQLVSLSLSLCRCVWWESPETTSFLTRPRPSSGGLITSRAARLPPGSQVKGQTSDVMGKVAMRTETMTGPPGAAGEPGSSPETGLKRFGTARLSRGTLLTASSCGLLTSCWEWPRMTAATGTEEVNRHQPQNTRDKQTNHTSLPGYELLLKWWTGPDLIQSRTHHSVKPTHPHLLYRTLGIFWIHNFVISVSRSAHKRKRWLLTEGEKKGWKKFPGWLATCAKNTEFIMFLFYVFMFNSYNINIRVETLHTSLC